MSAEGRLATVVRLRTLAEKQARATLAAASVALLQARVAAQAERQRYAAVAFPGPSTRPLRQQRFTEEWAAAAARAAERTAVAAEEAREQSQMAWAHAAGELQAIERVVQRRTEAEARAGLRREQIVSDDLAAAVRLAAAAYQPAGAA